MKPGDLIMVDSSRIPYSKHGAFISVITAVCLPDEQVNGMHLIEVLEAGMKKWYPVGCIRVINGSR